MRNGSRPSGQTTAHLTLSLRFLPPPSPHPRSNFHPLPPSRGAQPWETALQPAVAPAIAAAVEGVMGASRRVVSPSGPDACSSALHFHFSVTFVVFKRSDGESAKTTTENKLDLMTNFFKVMNVARNMVQEEMSKSKSIYKYTWCHFLSFLQE